MAKFKFTFTVTVTSVKIALLSSIAVVGFYSYWSRDIKDITNFTLKTIGTAAGIVSALYVGENIQHTAEARKEEEELRKTDRALNYISQWNDPNFYIVRDVVKVIVPIIKDEKENEHSRIINESVTSKPELDQKVNDILNFLEEVSMAVNENLVNVDIIRNFFEFIIKRYVSVFEVYINEKRRLRKYPDMYINLTSLNQIWANNNHT